MYIQYIVHVDKTGMASGQGEVLFPKPTLLVLVLRISEHVCTDRCLLAGGQLTIGCYIRQAGGAGSHCEAA